MGGSESYDAAKAIKQTCDDMVDGYAQLVEAGAATLSNIKSTIGQLTQYRHEFIFQGGHRGVEYRDQRMGGWERALIALGGTAVMITEEPHPERQRAYDALATTQGEVDNVDEKFELDSADMRDTVGSMANHMAGWVDTVAQLSTLIFPSFRGQIPSSGGMGGWRSPDALDQYEENLGLQHGAHDKTQDLIRELLRRDASFLQKMAKHLTVFADLQREHDQEYIDMATGSWVPKELTVDWVIGKIGDIASFVKAHLDKQVEEAEKMIGILNDAVVDILDTEVLRGDINKLSQPTDGGEGDGLGWPMPGGLSQQKESGTSSSYDLTFNTQYFKDHTTFWSNLSSDFDPVIATGSAVPAIESMFLQFPAFNSTTTAGLNTLASDLNSKALERGQQATQALSDLLDATIRTYLAGEDLNTQEAQRLEDILNG